MVAASAVPWLLGAATIVLMLSIISIRRLLTTSRVSTIVLPSMLSDGGTTVVCGFTLTAPARLDVSYPLGKCVIEDSRVIFQGGPVGDFVLTRNDGARLVRASQRGPLHRTDIETAALTARIYVRDRDELRAAFSRHGWMTP